MGEYMHALFPVTVHMLFIRENNILLSRRFRTGYMDGYYSVPAGHLDGGETVIQAAIRESYEETGTAISSQDISFATVVHRLEDEERIDFFVWVKQWNEEPTNTEPHKCDDLRWFPLSNLPTNLIPYVDQGLQNALQGIRFSEFGWMAQA
jgi:8-oxo-dGTP diphosphatase